MHKSITRADEKVDALARKRIGEDLEANLLVEASAGSGKTTALVDRMIALVANGVSVENIAAVTFTRRAADELRGALGRLSAQGARATIFDLRGNGGGYARNGIGKCKPQNCAGGNAKAQGNFSPIKQKK